MMHARLRALERSLAPAPRATIEEWCTREGEPCQPPEDVRRRVEEEAAGAWRCGVWVPDHALVFLFGHSDDMQIFEMQ